MARSRHQDHLDEIASLLAQGYLRLLRKGASVNTCGQLLADGRARSLDALRLAEHPLARTNSLTQEDAHDDIA